MSNQLENQKWLKELVRSIPDFPKPGIDFKDITPVLLAPGKLKKAAESLAEFAGGLQIDLVAGIESRGFFLAPLVADILDVGILPIRKAGKLPGETLGIEYELEYGTACLEVHKDQVPVGENIFVVDDLLATGGTTKAAAELLQNGGAKVGGFGFMIELQSLGGRARLESFSQNITALAIYE